MAKVVVNFERCKGCGLCVEVCPQNLLRPSPEINPKGVHPVVAKNPDGCTGCQLCALICPDVAITIYQDE